jgi:hypothetical protein
MHTTIRTGYKEIGMGKTTDIQLLLAFADWGQLSGFQRWQTAQILLNYNRD